MEIGATQRFRLALSLLLVAGPLFAQADRGTITGTVTDPAGAVIPSAKVSITRIATNITLQTTNTDAGEFVATSLAVGEYRIAVESPGFATAVHNKILLNSGTTVRLDTKLSVSANVQSIDVEAGNPVLQTDDGKFRNDIPNQLIQGLPTVVSGNMRSPFDLAALTPGVSSSDTDVRIGGGQQAAWGALLDGGSVAGNRLGSALWSGVNSPALDAIDQFTVDTNGFKAEYGRAGGGVVSFVSKSFRLPTLANWNGDIPTITQEGWLPLQYRDRVGITTRNNPSRLSMGRGMGRDMRTQYETRVTEPRPLGSGGEIRVRGEN